MRRGQQAYVYVVIYTALLANLQHFSYGVEDGGPSIKFEYDRESCQLHVPEIAEHDCILNCLQGPKGTRKVAPTIPIVPTRVFPRSKVSKFECVPKAFTEINTALNAYCRKKAAKSAAVAIGNAYGFVSNMRGSWYEAAKICAKSGFVLGRVTNTKALSLYFGPLAVWVGGTNVGDDEGSYYRLNSNASILLNPNKNTNCLLFGKGILVETPCDVDNYFYCEAPPLCFTETCEPGNVKKPCDVPKCPVYNCTQQDKEYVQKYRKSFPLTVPDKQIVCGRLYFIGVLAQTFENALRYCCKDEMDSIDPNSKEELDCVYELFNRTTGSHKLPPGVHHFWTSATDVGCDNNWGFCTYNRSTISLNPHIPWAENEPNNFRCAALRIDSRKDKPKFEFVAKKCSEQLRYICKSF